MGAGAGNGAPGTSQGYDRGLDHSTLVIAGVTTVGLIMAVLDKGGARHAVRLAY
jgi:hypothetical protein